MELMSTDELVASLDVNYQLSQALARILIDQSEHALANIGTERLSDRRYGYSRKALHFRDLYHQDPTAFGDANSRSRMVFAPVVTPFVGAGNELRGGYILF